jgi:hypothetical protein
VNAAAQSKAAHKARKLRARAVHRAQATKDHYATTNQKVIAATGKPLAIKFTGELQRYSKELGAILATGRPLRF